MTKRICNFAAGPCTLPLSALEKAQADFVDYKGTGMSIIEMSHRGKDYEKVHRDAMANLRSLLSIPDNFEILLLQGGATLQFAMVPMNLGKQGKKPAYAVTGSWAKKALEEAQKLGEARVAWTGKEGNFTRMPSPKEIKVDGNDAYLHLTGNETIGGIEFQDYPDTGTVPVAVDMSSHILSRPVDFAKFGLVYAGAQKNLGPAGCTVVIIRKDILEGCNEKLSSYLSYKIHAAGESLYNTPPVFAIYVMNLTLEWVKEVGGLAEMEKRAIKRSDLIYDAIEASGGWYRCPVDAATRSRMNVCFRMPTEELEKKFLAEAGAAEMSGLKGHRSVGGCRASMYNAMPIAGAERLASFMADFRKKNS